MSYRVILLISVCLLFQPMEAQNFRDEQKKMKRVKMAYNEKWGSLKSEMKPKGIDTIGFELFLNIFKQDKKVEVWLKSKNSKSFMLFKVYDICSSSGILGPKRKQGDGQVPEGFYHVSVFNPYSNYHLSLGVSYPNASDKIIGKGNLGGDIMIHGDCVTIGCIPLTDKYMKELYILAVEAKNAGQQKISIHIFPTRLNEKGIASLQKEHSDVKLMEFWNNLKRGYDYFENNKTLPKITVDKAGKYWFN